MRQESRNIHSRYNYLYVGLAFGMFSKSLPLKRLMETDKSLAFWHPKPSWEKHILIVPKKRIKSLLDLQDEDNTYVTDVYVIVKRLVKELGWEKQGYTLLTNGGDRQEVNQLHFHLIAGNQLS